ncbi:MAG TPA: glycosyltransferase [Chitinophagaceae bacterium]|nr:glycosyltransferase [Chitinophagaceae bacterium]
MNILHLASWYPTEDSPINGIFIERKIKAISDGDKQNKHYLISLASTSFASFKKPIGFIRLKTKSNKPQLISRGNLKIINHQFIISHQRLFGTEVKQFQKQIEKILKRFTLNINLIHAHVAMPAGAVALGMKQKFQIPYIISEQMGEFPFAYLLPQKELIIESVQQAAQVIALSRFQRTQIEKFTGRRAEIFPNVVEVKNETSVKQHAKTANEKFQFILVGILSVVKGVDILIEAAAILKAKGIHHFHITIAGSGKIEQDLKQLAVQKEMDSYFSWTGALRPDEVLQKIKECDAFVCASRHESFGVALVEALSLGKPVVATRCGGPQDTVNEENGLLVENENPLALAEGLKWMMQNAEQFDSKKIAAETVNKYGSAVIASQYLRLYEEVLKN